MSAVLFPHLGLAVDQGTILAWIKQPGQPVKPGEELVELALEKAVNVITAEEEGVLLAVYAPPGAVVAQGETLGWIGQAHETPPHHRPVLLGWAEDVAPPPEASGAVPTFRPGSLPGKQTRQLLKNQLRETTAHRMAHSWQAPKVDLFQDVDFTGAVAHRQALKAQGREAPSYNLYLAQAVTLAFQEFPQLNLHWTGSKAQAVEGVHIGLAVALEEGLLTVSLRNTAGVDLEELQRKFKAQMRKALGMTLAPEDMFGNSLTITNLGETGITAFAALLNPPEVFILSVGALEERPVVRDGAVTVRTMATLGLSFDHRAVDGQPAAKLLAAIRRNLENL
ncbi:MAG: 2-oxo acid dehydrogenase subunit E2 [Deltaproteobacteria bacterium]|nr:2-oxo acid dehydrogenase subunit E2 [Deltaproteobacteria bacterium]